MSKDTTLDYDALVKKVSKAINGADGSSGIVETQVLAAIKKEMLESIHDNVLNKYSPRRYRRRSVGGIDDPQMIQGRWSNNVLTVMNVAPLEGPRLSNVYSQEDKDAAGPNRKVGWGYGVEIAPWFDNLSKKGNAGSLGGNPNDFKYQLRFFEGGQLKRYKGQTPLASLIEHGAYNPWNDKDYPWMHPRKFMPQVRERVKNETGNGSVKGVLKSAFEDLGFVDVHYK